MKKLLNEVSVTGALVKNALEEKVTKGEESITGSIVLRTSDNSEHEINLFTYRYKKDDKKNVTDEETFFYKAYKTIMEEYRDIEKCPENPDVISIKDGFFDINDYKSKKDGEVKSYNKINAKFTNRIEPKDYATTVCEAKFEVEGLIESITDEVVKGIPTGNLKVVLNVVKQMADGFGKDAKYEVDSLVPVTMIVLKDMVEDFKGAGYYDGSFAKFVGSIINTTEVTTIVEKQAFGKDNERTVKRTVQRNEIKSGTAPTTMYEHELTDEIIQQLISKRKLKLSEVKAGKSDTANTTEITTPTPPVNNPFASNPFATK